MQEVQHRQGTLCSAHAQASCVCKLRICDVISQAAVRARRSAAGATATLGSFGSLGSVSLSGGSLGDKLSASQYSFGE